MSGEGIHLVGSCHNLEKIESEYLYWVGYDLHPDEDTIHVAEKVLCSFLQCGLVEVKFELHNSLQLTVDSLQFCLTVQRYYSRLLKLVSI